MNIPQDSFNDDAPVFNWEVFQGEPARSWRQPNPPKFTAAETAKAGVIGLLMFLLGIATLIIGFVL